MSLNSLVRDHPWRLLFLVVLAGSLPALVAGLPQAAHDYLFHLQWTREFAEQFWSGELYPRWLDRLNNGLGSPAFYYYPPVEGYLASLFYPLAPLDPSGRFRLALVVSVATFLSGVTAWRWLGLYTEDPERRFVATLLYALGPYHFAVDVYFRGAVAESLAFALFPLIFGSLHTMVSGDRRFPRLLPLWLALLFLTHTLSALMLIPFLILYVLMLGPYGRRVVLLLRLGLVGVVAGAMAAIYLLPALMQMEWANMAVMFGRYGDSFLPNIGALLDEGSGVRTSTVVIDLAALLLLAFGLLPLLRGRAARFVEERGRLYWSVAFFGALFLTTSLSAPLWHLVSPLQRLQFPWRFLAIATVALSPLLLLMTGRSERGGVGKRGELLLAASVLLFTVGVILVGYIVAGRDATSAESLERSEVWQIDATEYTPRCVVDPVGRLDPPGAGFAGAGPLHAVRSRGEQIDPGEIELQGEGRDLRLRLEPRSTPLPVRLHRYYYPTWRAVGDRGLVALSCSGPDGLLELRLPAGTTTVTVTMVASRWEVLGRWISLGGLFAFILILLSGRQRDVRRGEGG